MFCNFVFQSGISLWGNWTFVDCIFGVIYVRSLPELFMLQNAIVNFQKNMRCLPEIVFAVAAEVIACLCKWGEEIERLEQKNR